MAQHKQPRAIRDEYVEFGTAAFYAEQGHAYRNPHEGAIRSTLARCHQSWKLDLSHVLDLACGSGEVTLLLRDLGASRIDGVDPFTAQAYADRTGQTALQFSFEEIAAGALENREHSLIVCSYALHLLELSRLPALLQRLALHSPALLILSPHKRPVGKDGWGWELENELYHQRVRARLFETVSQA